MMQRAFSLVELCVTLLIISILSLIAYPAYHASLITAARAKAVLQLKQADVLALHYYTATHTYIAMQVSDVGLADDAAYHYRITKRSMTDFLLEAIPQKNEGDCGTLSLNQLGQETISGRGTMSVCFGE